MPMCESINMQKDEEHTTSEVFGTPLNGHHDDSGYRTLSTTPSIPRNYFSSTPASLYCLTPGITSSPPNFKLNKDQLTDSPIFHRERDIPEFNLQTHRPDQEHDSVIQSQTEISFDASKCHICRKDHCYHVHASATRVPPNTHTALSPVPGQEIGERYIDFFKELVQCRRFPGIASQILSYLTPKELRSVCCVSKLWRQACLSDNSANVKRLKELDSLKKNLYNVEKENELQLKEQAVIQQHFVRDPLGNIANVFNTASQKRNEQANLGNIRGLQVQSRYQLFQEEAKKLLACESLQPCPRCTSPSRVNPFLKRGLCSRKFCAYDFCIKCCCQYHDCRPCPLLNKPKFPHKDVIGSKGSRRNLKRL